MSKDSLVMGVAGTFFGLLVGWIIGSQQAAGRPAPPAAAAPRRPGVGRPRQPPAPPPLDESRASAMKTTAQQNPADAVTRVQLGNLYFDAGRFQEAADLVRGGAEDQSEGRQRQHRSRRRLLLHEPAGPGARAVRPVAGDRSEPRQDAAQPGIVRAFGKQDLKGAAEVVAEGARRRARQSEEARARGRRSTGFASAHPDVGIPRRRRAADA